MKRLAVVLIAMTILLLSCTAQATDESPGSVQTAKDPGPTYDPVHPDALRYAAAHLELRWNLVAWTRLVDTIGYAAALYTPPAPARSYSGGSGGGGGGGGCNPAGIIAAESGGSYTARNPSGAGGAYQFMPGTWAGYGGYSNAEDAPPAVQDARFAEVWAGGAGAGHWSASVC